MSCFDVCGTDWCNVGAFRTRFFSTTMLKLSTDFWKLLKLATKTIILSIAPHFYLPMQTIKLQSTNEIHKPFVKIEFTFDFTLTMTALKREQQRKKTTLITSHQSFSPLEFPIFYSLWSNNRMKFEQNNASRTKIMLEKYGILNFFLSLSPM